MTGSPNQTLERMAERVPVPSGAYERLLRRRDHKSRNRRISAATFAIVVTLLAAAAFSRAIGTDEGPASQPPTPAEGIFSGMGGWIAYGAGGGVWAVDPENWDRQVELTHGNGEPQAWSPDGSNLLLVRPGRSFEPNQTLSVLHEDGSETVVYRTGAETPTGAAFSPDGSKVVFALVSPDGSDDSRIVVVDADGGAPRLLVRENVMLFEPVFSPDGSQIAYFAGWGDHDNSLLVMNADGSEPRAVLPDAGMMKNSAGNRGLAWSLDGTHLMWGNGYDPYHLYVVGADGSGLTRLPFECGHPQWSADRTQVACVENLGIGGLEVKNASGDALVGGVSSGEPGPWNPADRSSP
jgi:hypothetical protein